MRVTIFSLFCLAASAETLALPALRYRNIGPARGGRVTAIAGVRSQPHTFYMGATGGGVWKTTDAGITWTPISDGQMATASIGAIDVADSDPNVVYVGTGSAAIRSNVIHGRGVYRSGDAGRTWQFSGLRNAGQIGSIRVHPGNPDVAYVAALGQPFLEDTARLSFPADERGVFRTKDGGKTWQKVLYANDRTGVVSLSLNPANPDEIYAGAWRAERKPWTIISGGPAAEGGIYKSTNGGDTWTHLSQGLPGNLIGKVDVDVSRANPRRVYAILEAPGTQAGVYRSDDAGATWRQLSSQSSLIARPFYYTYIDADPKDADTVYVNNLGFHKSTDGGKSWRSISTPHGDNHGVWINPDHPEILLQANDGGANVSLNGGRSWSTIYNQPTAEIYQVAVDNRFPYRVYGAQQDNTTLIVPSLPERSGRPDLAVQFWMTGPGCETGPIMPHPQNPDIVYGSCKGEFSRMDLRTGQEQQYWVTPHNRYGHAARDLKLRHQRVSPMEISPHNPKAIYFGSQSVHRTLDEGVTWQTISPDLTANEPSRQGISGEPITRDITGEEMYSTLYAIRESALEAGVIWAGANDGPVHVTRDNGRTWKNVTPRDLPPGGRVQNIEPSPHRKGSAYIAVYRYLLGDFRPYLYRTDNYGTSWTLLTTGSNGIPSDCPTRVVREDPARAGLLYAGTEFGMFLSLDNGANWQSFQLNLPVTPVTDLRVHRHDLVLSTMGRSFWILDNLTALHQLGREAQAAAHLYAPRAGYRMTYGGGGGGGRGGAWSPEYPSNGAQIDYRLAGAAAVNVEILDAAGKAVRSYSSEAARAPAAQPSEAPADEDSPRARFAFAAVRLGATAGLHRFSWDLRNTAGFPVTPGRYQVRLTAGQSVLSQALEVRMDPRVAAAGVTVKDLEEQLALQMRMRETAAEARALAQKVEAVMKARPQEARLRDIHAQLVTARGAYPQPMLIDQFSSALRMISGADVKVGRVAFTYFEELKQKLDALRAQAQPLLSAP